MSNTKKDPYGKEAVIEILQRRDGMTVYEAKELVEEVQQEVTSLFESDDFDYEAVNNIIEENFGLEPDYAMAFVPFFA